MCYSFESSISSWIVSFLICSYMLVNPQDYSYWLPLFILTFTQIQIMESILWTSLESDNIRVNEITTKLLSFMLWLQPLMNIILAYKHSEASILLYGIYLYIIIILYHYLSSRTDKFISTIGPNKHLEWNRYDIDNNKYDFVLGDRYMSMIYLIGLFGPFLFMEDKMKYISFLFFGSTFFLSYVKFKSEFGTMWCYYSVFASILALAIQK